MSVIKSNRRCKKKMKEKKTQRKFAANKMDWAQASDGSRLYMKSEKRSEEKKKLARKTWCLFHRVWYQDILMSVHQFCNAKQCYYSPYSVLLCMHAKLNFFPSSSSSLHRFHSLAQLEFYPKPSIIHTQNRLLQSLITITFAIVLCVLLIFFFTRSLYSILSLLLACFFLLHSFKYNH